MLPELRQNCINRHNKCEIQYQTKTVVAAEFFGDNASAFVDPEHEHKLVRMIERAVRKKAVGQSNPLGADAPKLK